MKSINGRLDISQKVFNIIFSPLVPQVRIVASHFNSAPESIVLMFLKKSYAAMKFNIVNNWAPIIIWDAAPRSGFVFGPKFFRQDLIINLIKAEIQIVIPLIEWFFA